MSDGDGESETEVSVTECLSVIGSLSLSATVLAVILTRVAPQITYTPNAVVEIFIRAALMTSLASFFALLLWATGNYVYGDVGVTGR